MAGDTELGVGGGPGSCLIRLHRLNPNPSKPNHPSSPAGAHFLGVTCDRGHRDVPSRAPPVQTWRHCYLWHLPPGRHHGVGGGMTEPGALGFPLVVLGPLTQEGGVTGYGRFTQVWLPPRVDDWAERFGSSNRGGGFHRSGKGEHLWLPEIPGAE